jgi:hypothetical protein
MLPLHVSSMPASRAWPLVFNGATIIVDNDEGDLRSLRRVNEIKQNKYVSQSGSEGERLSKLYTV